MALSRKKKKLKKTKSGDFVDKSTGLTENPTMNQNNLDEEKPKKKKKKKNLKKTQGGDFVDKSTGLTETPASDQGKETEDAKKLREHQEKQDADKLEVTINKKPTRNQRAKVKVGGKRSQEVRAEMEEEGRGEEYHKHGGMYDRIIRAKNIAEDPSLGQDYKDIDETHERYEQEVEQERIRKEAEEREQELEETEIETQEGQALKQALDNEAESSSNSEEELLQKKGAVSEILRTKSDKRSEKKKREKKEKKNKNRIIDLILKKVPNIAIDKLVDMDMKDIFNIAARIGVSDPEAKIKRKAAESYLDTVQQLGVQDYFPQVGQNIAVGTFQGARIGSQTVYAGGGGLVPMGLYDAKRRAMKAGLNASTKSLENMMKFMNLPPVYNDDYQQILREEYEKIFSSDMSRSEKNAAFSRMNNAGAQIMSAYQSARNLQDRMMNPKNSEKDQIYIPDDMKAKMYQFIGNSFSPEYLRRAIVGDVNLAKEAAKLRFYDDMIYNATEAAKNFTSFKKTKPSEAFLSDLTEEQVKTLNQWKKGDGTLATQPLVKKYVDYDAEDIDATFDAIFKDEDGNLRSNFSKDQEKQARQLFKDMLGPSFLEDMKTMSTGYDQSSGISALKQKKENIYSNITGPQDEEMFENAAKNATSIFELTTNLQGQGRVRPGATSAGLGSAVTVERQPANADYYPTSSRFQRGGGKYFIRCKIGANGSDQLLTADQVLVNMNNGKTVFSSDGNAQLTKKHMTDFKTSIGGGSSSVSRPKFQLMLHSETPYYMDNLTMKGITNNARVNEYDKASDKGMMWQDIGEPHYSYTTNSVTTEKVFPFYVQGAPYKADDTAMEKLDREFKRPGAYTYSGQ